VSVAVILGLVFGSLTLVAYALLSGGSEAWEHHAERVVSRAETSLSRLFVFVDARRLLGGYVAALIGVPLVLVLLDQPSLVVLAGFVVVVASPSVMLRRLAARRRRVINLALPDGLAQIAGAMRAGSTFTTAVQSMVEESPGPLGQEFGLLLREQRLGTRLEEALDNLGERVQTEEMDLVISAALIAQEVGGNLAEILQRLSETIRRKLEMEGRIRALTSQGVLQGRVVTALPFLILAALMGLEPEAMSPIFSGLLGWCFLGTIIVLQIVGSVVIGRIVRIEI